MLAMWGLFAQLDGCFCMDSVHHSSDGDTKPVAAWSVKTMNVSSTDAMLHGLYTLLQASGMIKHEA